MDLGRELGSISRTSLKTKINTGIAVILTIISELVIIAFMAIEELFQFKAYKPNIVDDYLTPIIFIALIIFIPYLVYSTSSAKYTGIIYENGLEVTDTYSKLKQIIYYIEIEEFYIIYGIRSTINTILIKKKDGKWIIFSKRNGGSLSWEKKLVNAFSGAIYPSYNDKFISGEKIPFSFYSNETSHKSIDSLTEFIKTTEPNTLLLSKNGIEVNGSVFSKENVHNLSLNNTLISKNNIFLTLLKKLD